MRCFDCGKGRGPLCPECSKVALTLGHTADERLALIGCQPLDMGAVQSTKF